MAAFRIVYLVADLRRVGPTNQTLNIICNANDSLEDILVLTLFKEPLDSLKPLFEERGIRCKSLNLNRKNFILAVWKLQNFIQNNSIGLIHSYGTKPDILLYLTSKICQIQYVLTQRNIPVEDYPQRMNRFVGKILAQIHTFVLKHSKHVVACSKYLCEVMKTRYGCSQIVPIQNGIDLDRFKNRDKILSRNELGFENDVFIFISTGLFLERKHNDEIIKAFLKMGQKNARLVLLGDGPLLQKMKSQYATEKQIFFAGKVANVAQYLSSADCFVSASDSEGLPNAVLEALACQVPVVLSDIPQHREILDELPDCGMLFPVRDVESLTTKMAQILEGKTKFSNEIRKLLDASPFSTKAMGKKYKEFYEEIQNEK